MSFVMPSSREELLREVENRMKDISTRPTKYLTDAFKFASHYGWDKAVELLLTDKRVDPNVQNGFAIGVASSNGHDKVVKLLLEDGRADPSVRNDSAIRSASGAGRVKVVELLLGDNRVNPGADDNYPIKSASTRGHIEIVKLLIPRIYISQITDEKILSLAKEMKKKSLKEIINSDISMDAKIRWIKEFKVYSIRIENENNKEMLCLTYEI